MGDRNKHPRVCVWCEHSRVCVYVTRIFKALRGCVCVCVCAVNVQGGGYVLCMLRAGWCECSEVWDMQGVCETAEERGWESGKAEMFPMDIMDMGEDGAMCLCWGQMCNWNSSFKMSKNNDVQRRLYVRGDYKKQTFLLCFHPNECHLLQSSHLKK